MDYERQDLEFNMSDIVFMRVAPYRYVMRFKQKGKLTLRFIGPFEILKHITKVSYQLALLISMKQIHNVFHVSSLHKYISYLSHVLRIEHGP